MKKRRKGGRPRKQGVARTQSGAISRSAEARAERVQEVVAVALDARMRHTGLPRAKASDPMAGSALGLLLLDKRITREQYEAGVAYAETMARYYAATGIPFPSARAMDIFRVRGLSGDPTPDSEAKARAIANGVMKMEGAFLSCAEGPMVKRKTFEVCVLDEQNARNWPKHTLGYVERGLTAIRSLYS